MTQAANQAAAFIKEASSDFKPRLGILLGSGLGAFVDSLTKTISISYERIPGFPSCTVEGHAGKLYLGYLHSIPVVCCQGRIHYYETGRGQEIKTLVRTLKCIGCEILLISGAVGSLNRDIPIGRLVLIKDHINFQLPNPLVGINEADFGPRFVNMEEAYDLTLRRQFLTISRVNNLSLVEGVLAGFLGPSFETPAEIHLLKAAGVDVVSMSVIPEVIVARHCDLRVVSLCVVSNWAAGLGDASLSHQLTLQGAEKALDCFVHLITLMCSHSVF